MSLGACTVGVWAYGTRRVAASKHPTATLPPRAPRLRRLPARARTLTAIAAVGFAVAAPAALAGQQSTTIGTGAKTCELGPGADCRGVVHRWTAEHHGNLRKAKFTKSDLLGADFRGAKLRRADLRANLKGARFHAPPGAGKQANQTPSCAPGCQGADLTGANLSGVDLTGANLAGRTGAALLRTRIGRARLVEWAYGAATSDAQPGRTRVGAARDEY